VEPFASDRYQILAPLGGGGMAEVFLAVATGAEGFRKPVAIKRMLPHLAVNEEIARMFLAEARLAMHLHHQNIVSVFDVGRGPEGLYLVMELVDGWDLGQVLGNAAKARSWMPEPLALYVAQQVANGLSHAYRKTEDGKPIMAAHRDLTPSNIMVTADGEVKIADFGIAKVDTGQTEPGTFKGKIPYAAPEVIRGESATHLSDQFSLGVVIHRLTSGQYPYGYSDNPVAFNDLLAKAPPAPCQGLSAECVTLVRTMLAKKHEDRYPSIEVAGHALARLLAKSGAVIGAPQLAHFLSGLKLPPSPRSRVPKESPAPPEPPTQAAGPGFQEDPFPSWNPPPGPALDASGRLTGAPETPSPARARMTAMLEQIEPVQRPAREVELESGLEAEAEPLVTAREEPSRQPLPPSQEWVPGYEPLPGRYGAGARKPSSFPRSVALLLVLLAVGGAGASYLLWGPRELRAKYYALTGPPNQAVLTILSEPDGAQVRIAGKPMGTTPLMQENLYPRGVDVEVQVTKKGFQPWTGRIRGGEAVTVEARLKR
jgi:serine/threonine-protein kinase